MLERHQPCSPTRSRATANTTNPQLTPETSPNSSPAYSNPKTAATGGPPRPAPTSTRSCSSRTECLEFAFDSEEIGFRWGVWGGLTARERGWLARDHEQGDEAGELAAAA